MLIEPASAEELPASELDVPPEHRRAAEEIRAHLVAVRGGAPFLSSADARLLVGWLDDGVSVASVLQAIERAAESRRKKRSRLPLTLTRAKIHLGRAAYTVRPAVIAADTSDHPLLPAIVEVAGKGQVELAEKLRAIEGIDAEDTLRQALAEVRPFLHTRWEELPKADRDARVRAAAEDLAPLELGLNEQQRLAEEIVRDELRRDWPMLDAAFLWSLVHRGVA